MGMYGICLDVEVAETKSKEKLFESGDGRMTGWVSDGGRERETDWALAVGERRVCGGEGEGEDGWCRCCRRESGFGSR